MSLKLTLHTQPDVPLEADILAPDKLGKLDLKEVEKATIYHGNVQTALADFFTVSGTANGELVLEGDLSRVKHIGSGMTAGKLSVYGNAGAHLGTGMQGGTVYVEGNAADWVAPEMAGGRVHITGNAGHMVGSAYRGGAVGMTGGEIIINGNVGNEAGHAMRNGLIAVGGDAGDFTGVDMLAGTIAVCGRMGIRNGAGMKRGTIISMHDTEMLPTFSYACCYHPTYLRIYLQYLVNQGLNIDDSMITGRYERWCGDAVELNKGEILLYKA